MSAWRLSHRADPAAVALADRHYNRQHVGSPQFVPPGRCLVLVTQAADAFWVSSWPFAEYVRHEWAGAWMCSAFRNEGPTLSSSLIREAVAATRWRWGDPPPLGMVTFVDPTKVRRKRDWGRCYRKAGWEPCGMTKGGLVALRLRPEVMPEPMAPMGAQLALTALEGRMSAGGTARAYYGDNDRDVCAWLRNLIAAGLIPDGDVDERSIADVQPSDLRGYRQVHMFCGIAGWPLALQLAGWGADRAVWTGSCPCQPLSSAGKHRGERDERHLWPEFHRLIAECRPPVVFGEQVASADGREWLAGVRVDLEALGFAVGAADLCAAGVGAPHIRQRLYWVAARLADAGSPQRRPVLCGGNGIPDRADTGRAEAASGTGTDSPRDGHGLEHATGDGRDARRAAPGGRGAASGRGDGADGLDDSTGARAGRGHAALAGGDGPDDGLPGTAGQGSGRLGHPAVSGLEGRGGGPGACAGQRLPAETGAWDDSRIVWCDERAFGRGFVPRRVGTQPRLSALAARLPAGLGPGVPRMERLGLLAAKANRRMRLRGYGNAICPQVAAVFIRAYMESQR